MDTLQLLGSVLGFGFLGGLRLYGTVLALGLIIRFHWLALGHQFAPMGVLADWRVLTVAAVACVIEFFADKIPWVDSAWDTVHTIIRPVGVLGLTYTALGNADPSTRVILALLSGGVALSSHSAKAATRALVNHSPEPVSNIVVSLAEDAIVPAGIWMTLYHPTITLFIVAFLVAIIAWLVPKIFRLLRRSFLAVRNWIDPPPQNAGAGVR